MTNELLEKEVAAFDALTSNTDVQFVLGKARAKMGDVAIEHMLEVYREHFTQALTRAWNEGAKVGAQTENGAWMMGIRCTNCGGEKKEDLSDMCGKCFEEV